MNDTPAVRRDGAGRPVILYLVTEDWYFVAHRLTMARAARRAGYDVHVATRVGTHGEEIRAEGFHLHRLNWRRGSINPRHVMTTIRQVRRLYRELAPALVHHVALEPIMIGLIAAAGLRIVCVNAFSGLGFIFTSKGPRARALRLICTSLLRYFLPRANMATLVENADDREIAIGLGARPERTYRMSGCGVDLRALVPLAEPDGPVTAAYVGRMLEDKGVRTLVAAHERLTRAGRKIRLLLAGGSDPANPTSISGAEIAGWSSRPGVVVLGHVADIRKVWAEAHIAVLPSRREGLPMSLVEAAACARPIVATDVPGCREIARADINAILVPSHDAEALASAIDRLAHDAHLRRQFGAAGRRLVEDEFSCERVGREIVAVYDELVAQVG